jgi:hypothetical protein
MWLSPGAGVGGVGRADPIFVEVRLGFLRRGLLHSCRGTFVAE